MTISDESFVKPDWRFLFSHPAHFLSFGFGSGLARKAPGTFGTASRNLIIGPGSRSLNANFTRDVRLGGNRTLSVNLRANNLLNLVNYTGIDTRVNSPTFGQVTSVSGMRSMQLNLRFRF